MHNPTYLHLLKYIGDFAKIYIHTQEIIIIFMHVLSTNLFSKHRLIRIYRYYIRTVPSSYDIINVITAL